MKFYANDPPQGDFDGIWLAPDRTDADEDVDCELNVPVTKDFGIFRNEEHNKKAWHLLTAGTYEIAIDLDKLRATFTLTALEPTAPYEQLDAIWLVGPSAPAGWNMPKDGNTDRMTTTDKITYTWTGNLAESVTDDWALGTRPGLAFVTDFSGVNPDWGNTLWLFANDNNSHQEGDNCTPVTPGIEQNLVKKMGPNNNSNMFDITEAGSYTVTITLNPPADGSTSAKVLFVKN
jgi:hypothetical protein